MRELFGCAISPGTLHTTRGRLAEKLVGVEARIKAGLRHAEVLGVDETGLRVAGQSHWIHVARTDDLTHYGADARRGKAGDGRHRHPAAVQGCVPPRRVVQL
jgi:transposase